MTVDNWPSSPSWTSPSSAGAGRAALVPVPRSGSLQRLNVAGTGARNHPGGAGRTPVCVSPGRYPYARSKTPQFGRDPPNRPAMPEHCEKSPHQSVEIIRLTADGIIQETTAGRGRGRARPQAGTTARDRRRGRGLGVDQLGVGGLARRLRRGQRRKRLAAQHRGRGTRGGPDLLRGVRGRRGPRPGHGL